MTCYAHFAFATRTVIGEPHLAGPCVVLKQRVGLQCVELLHQSRNMPGEETHTAIPKFNSMLFYESLLGAGFNPFCKNISQDGNFHQVEMKIKNI